MINDKIEDESLYYICFCYEGVHLGKTLLPKWYNVYVMYNVFIFK